MKNDFVIAIAQLSAEKNLDSRTVFEAVESAMASALKKDELQYADLVVKIDPDTGDIHAWRRYKIMSDDDIEDDEIQVSPERARNMGAADTSIGADVLESLEDAAVDAGRIAAQTAKQVVLQRLRDAEREAVFEEFTGKGGELVSGTVLRVEPGRRQVIIDLGRTEAVLPDSEQVRAEHYRVGQRVRVYVKEVYKASKGPQVVVSRSHPDFLRRLFELEVPEVGRGAVEIMGIARDPGHRSKVAVVSRQHGIDPIGSLVGVRGARIQNVINELGGERIDVIRWDPNPLAYIANALSPAEVVSVRLDEATNTAYLAVPDKQLSLAIGKEGQNARLAAKLTGRRIDITAESVLIRSGQELYQPPAREMEALPRPESAGARLGMPELPTEIAPSVATYARPGLPGERPSPQAPARAPEAAAAPEAELQLTPEQEIVAAFSAEAMAAPEASPSPAETARQRERERENGLRFAEDIRGLRDETEDEERARRAHTGRGSGGGGSGASGGRARPGAPTDRPRPVRQARRFEINEEDIEEGLIELHGGPLIEDELDETEDE